MNNKQPYNIIRNAKIMLLSTASYGFESVQNSLDADISNLELSILYHNKIYDEKQSQFVREQFDKLTYSIDELINAHKKQIFASIDRLMRDFTKNDSDDNRSEGETDDSKEK